MITASKDRRIQKIKIRKNTLMNYPKSTFFAMDLYLWRHLHEREERKDE